MKAFSIFCFCLAVSCLSCTKNLDETPFSFLSNSNLYQNEADVDKALTGAYSSLSFSGTNDLYFFLMSSGPSENVVARVKAGAQGRMTSLGFLDTDPQGGIWVDLFRGINRANAVLDNVDRAKLPPAIRDAKVGEARFLRALYYFYLVRWFGGVPLHLTETTDFSDESVKKPRSTVEEVYAVIVDDLLFAETKLPATVSVANNGRATSGAAKTLLGKVYLTMAGKPLMQTANYAKAVSKLQEVVGNYTLQPSFANLFSMSNEFNPEVIFARPNITGLDGAGTVHTFFAGAPNTPFAFNGGQYQFAFAPAFYNSFAATDVRRDVTFLYTYTDRLGRTVTYGSPTNPAGLPFGGPRAPNGVPMGKWKDPANTLTALTHGNDFILLRYADVLLMLAEAHNEAGNPAQALPLLNQVRARAGLTALTTTDQTALRAQIKQERKWELAGEFTEYFDLQRWGDLQASMATNPDALQLNVRYDPKLELFPIPLGQIQANGNLKQNPGY